MYLKILFHERVVAKISNISILRCLLARGVTAQLEMSLSGPPRVQPQTLCIPILLSTPNLPWCLAGTLQAFLHQITALALCSKPETVGPFKVLHWCIQSASWHYTPVLSLTCTTWHCHHRSSNSWEDQLAWWSTLSQCPVSPSAPSPSPALIIMDHHKWSCQNSRYHHHNVCNTWQYATTNQPFQHQTLQLSSYLAPLWGRGLIHPSCNETLQLLQLKTPACILTNNKACVWAFEKLCCGEFPWNPRVDLPPSFPPSVGAKPLFTMLLEPLSYHLTLPVAMPVSATTQLAKFAASSNTPRILWFSVHLSKAYC